MHLAAFIERICDDGIAAADRDYAEPAWREGAIAGFEACRGKTADELVELWGRANQEAHRRFLIGQASPTQSVDYDYWRARCKAIEIEWVLNCVSAALRRPLLPWLPTARGGIKAAEVVGVAAPHPEDVCEACGRRNITWFVDSDLWNRHARTKERDPMLCPLCFVERAEAGGTKPPSWRLVPVWQPEEERSDG